MGIDPSGLLVWVPLADKAAYREAWQYLLHDPGMHQLFTELYGSDNTYRVQTNNLDPERGDGFDPSNGVISWNPTAAIETEFGDAQSPALALGHEFDHAVRSDTIQTVI